MNWHLPTSEVNVATVASSSGKPRSARDSRKLDKRAITVRLEHVPTGIFVEAAIPEGHYSRAELRKLKDQLSAQLFGELESKVARHLRVPGRV